ncbi:MAG: phage tail tube protein, partial [Oscillospiraceae bacterium]|nr:phage tail tube protein [Oscillospiraceae bacterium]
MSVMTYNKNPISLREGKIFLDGVEIADGVKCQIKVTPDVWTGRLLGEQTPSSRWLGYSVTGTITRRRTTKWLAEKIAEYQSSHLTPEFKIQGIMNDPNSDYYEDNGSYTVTCIGCVLTGDLTLT